MNTPDQKNIIIIPDEERITIDKISKYEQSNSITKRITMIKNNPKLYIDPNLLLINVKNIENHKKANIKPSEILNMEGESFIRLSNTRDIAKAEYNQNKSPLSIMRILSEDRENIYVEVIAVNDLPKNLLPYLAHYDY